MGCEHGHAIDISGERVDRMTGERHENHEWSGLAIFLLVKDWQEDRVDILRCRLVCERLNIKLLYVKVHPQ